jgi:hypothetical protein
MPRSNPNVTSAEQLSRPGPWVPFASSRITEGRYDDGLEQIHVIFRDGTPWFYDHVPLTVWRAFKSSSSAGRFVTDVLDNYNHFRGGFDYASHEERTGEE